MSLISKEELDINGYVRKFVKRVWKEAREKEKQEREKSPGKLGDKSSNGHNKSDFLLGQGGEEDDKQSGIKRKVKVNR